MADSYIDPCRELVVHLSAVSKERWQEVDGMIIDSVAPGIVIGAPDKTRVWGRG